MLGKASNPLLEQAEQGIQSKVPAQLQANFSKIVTAGLTIMYSPQLAQARAQHMAQSTNPAQDAGAGAVRLISNLYQQSKGALPKSLIVPAATIFSLEYLDLVAKAGKTQITPDLISQSAKVLSQELLKLFKVTPDTLQQMQAKGPQGAQASVAQSTPPKPAGILGGAMRGA